MGKPILCLDFDGVIHSYISGWRGPTTISDPPVYGAMTFISEASKEFKINIFSSRSHQKGGIRAMQTYLVNAGLKWDFVVHEIDWPVHKPPATITIDDRALCFTGKFPDIENLKKFKVWDYNLNI